MSKYKPDYLIKGLGNNCLECGQAMERRIHKNKPIKTWYYTEWDVCKNTNCKKTVQHYEEFKSVAWRENEEQQNHLNNL